MRGVVNLVCAALVTEVKGVSKDFVILWSMLSLSLSNSMHTQADMNLNAFNYILNRNSIKYYLLIDMFFYLWSLFMFKISKLVRVSRRICCSSCGQSWFSDVFVHEMWELSPVFSFQLRAAYWITHFSAAEGKVTHGVLLTPLMTEWFRDMWVTIQKCQLISRAETSSWQKKSSGIFQLTLIWRVITVWPLGNNPYTSTSILSF